MKIDTTHHTRLSSPTTALLLAKKSASRTALDARVDRLLRALQPRRRGEAGTFIGMLAYMAPEQARLLEACGWCQVRR